MFGEPPIHKREVRVDDVADAKILLDEFRKEQFRLFENCPAQQFVILGIEFFIRCRCVDFVEPQPLT